MKVLLQWHQGQDWCYQEGNGGEGVWEQRRTEANSISDEEYAPFLSTEVKSVLYCLPVETKGYQNHFSLVANKEFEIHMVIIMVTPWPQHINLCTLWLFYTTSHTFITNKLPSEQINAYSMMVIPSDPSFIVHVDHMLLC